MKNILFFLLLASFTQAQTTTRTFVLGPDGVNYFDVTRITQDDGSYTESGSLIGPLPAIQADQADKIESKARELAAAAFYVSTANKVLNSLEKSDTAVIQVTGTSALKKIQDRYQDELLKPGWTIDNGTSAALVFTVNAQGVLRYSIGGAATKQAKIYGAVIRLYNYPNSTTNTDFFLSETGQKYFALPNRAVTIKKP